MNRRSFLRNALGDALATTGLGIAASDRDIPAGSVAYGIVRGTKEPLDQGSRVRAGELSFWVRGTVATGIDTGNPQLLDDARNEMIERIEIALEQFKCDGYKLRTDDYALVLDEIAPDVESVGIPTDGKGDIGMWGMIHYTRTRKR